jgi:SOS-response transcriptional repressor LexA
MFPFRPGDWVRLKMTGEEFDVKAFALAGKCYQLQSRTNPHSPPIWATAEELEIVDPEKE